MPRGGAKLSQFVEFNEMMQHVILAPVSDRWTWTLNKSGEFSVASVRKLIDDKVCTGGNQITRWIRYVPNKVNIHALGWVMTNSLATKFNISRRGIDIDSISCVNCGIGVETTSHLFFTCEMAQQVSHLINLWWDVPDMEINSYDSWKIWVGNIRLTSKTKMMFEGVYHVSWWLLWWYRNQKIFEAKTPNKALLFDDSNCFLISASACSLSTLHFLKLLENKLESMMILENKLESLKLRENKLESMKKILGRMNGLTVTQLASESEEQGTRRGGQDRAESNAETNHSKSGLGLPSIVALVMVIDKSWTLLERHEKAFYTGLTKFVDDCKPLVNSAGNIKCPCKSCRTVLWVSIKNLPKHITRYGWDPGYKTWVHHGEPDLPPLPPVIDNTRQPQMSDMIALLNDLSYIPPNNEQNEPIQEDIGETSNEPTQAKRNEFEELYASANEELYPGCDYVTRLDFMAKFTYFKVKGKLTDSIFNEILEFFQHVFPTTKGYKLPPSYYAIKKTFKTIGLGYESIHACVNDCFLFRGDNNKDLHFCPVCKTSRWKDSNTPGKKVPKKVLRYFPIIPRLQRLYKSSHTAKEMTWHATGKCTEPGKMQHPVDGRAWKNFDTKYPNFAKEPRNVRLGLAADGFNPFGNLSQAYSMWPVILTTYNLPPWLCMKESSFMLTLLIPGPKSPGKDIDVYLRPLIDDLKVLWALKGVETIDVATGQKFNMRAMVLWTINDFPARSSLSGWSGQGYKACPTCNEDTPSVRVLGKTAYVGHRRFLKKPHKWRRSLEFNGEIEDGDPPRKFDRDQIQAQLARLPTRVKGKHPSYGGVKIKRNVLVELNWTKRSIFYELEYWSFLTLKHNLDIMHIEKNVLEAILNTLLMNDKSKDTAKARQDLKKLGIRSGLWLGQTKNGKCSKPQAAYSFSPENRKKFCQFIKGVKLPDGFGSNFKHKVTDNDTNITGLKSHDCHIMMQRLLPYGLQQYLPDEVAKPIIELCSFFKQICSATLMEDDMLKAQSKVVDILCNLELIYPPAFFDIMIHLVIHLPLEALEGGPIRPRWMFPFERFMKKLKGYVRNKAKPEGSIAEGYVAEEALTFSSHYFRDVTTKFNRPDRNVDPPPPTCQFQVFRSLCKSIGLRSVIRFDAQELKKVIWYVLHNSPEIDTYRSQFKSKFPNKDMKEEFPNWFGSQIRQRHVDNDPGVSATSELFALACGPTPTPISVNSCVVNGVRFVVHSRDERRTTQNSGICSPGGNDGEMYYGQLQEILEFSYLSFKVVLFRVKWFDTRNEGRKVQRLVLRNNMTQILTKDEAFKDDQYILATQFLDGGVIVVEEDPDVIHFDNSSDLPLSTSLNDLNNATLHIDGQSTEVDALPDIIDVPDEDDDIIGDEDALPYDLADSDVEDLINVDDDGVEKVYSSEEED
ncbi:hypothetical protein Tco_0286548 [Tanacetum coccineum]